MFLRLTPSEILNTDHIVRVERLPYGGLTVVTTELAGDEYARPIVIASGPAADRAWAHFCRTAVDLTCDDAEYPAAPVAAIGVVR